MIFTVDDMTLPELVCSPPLATRIKELGVKQDSFFYQKNEPNLKIVDGFSLYFGDQECREKICMFTAGELGEMLANGLSRTWKTYNGEWHCEYHTISETDEMINASGQSEADARANLLITLIEKGLWKPQK